MKTEINLARPLLDDQGVVVNALLTAEIADSWQRCLDRGLDPTLTSDDCVLGFESFYQRKQHSEHYLSLARPEMELLSNQVAGHNYLIAFGDADGVVLDVLTDVEAEGSDMAQAIIPGSVWDEDLRGTNALGLVAKRHKQFIVSGAEHFFAANSTISCIAAPIFRSNGSLAGVLDVTSPLSDRERHTASLVALAAQNISNRLFIEDHRNDLIVLCHPRAEYLATQSAGLLAFNQHGQMTGATAKARDILPDIATLGAPCFSDVFQNGYDRVFGSIQSGKTAQLRDRRGSTVFVQLRLTRGQMSGLRPPQPRRSVGLPAVQMHPAAADPAPQITGDPGLGQQIKISAETAAARLPVRVCGRSGSGLSETARAIHAQLPDMDHCIEIDCSSAQENPLEFLLHGQILDGDGLANAGPTGAMLNTAGNVTVILDGIEGLGPRALPVVKRLLAQFDRKARDETAPSRWALIVTERFASAQDCPVHDDALGFDDFWGHSFCVPPLAQRMDLQPVAQNILAEFTPHAKLTSGAVDLIRQIGDPLTFYAMRRLIFQLSRRTASGVITRDKVLELLPHLSKDSAVCPSCTGHSTREANCRRIRKTVRDCDGNISLAARQLGVSRNTVYKHTLDKQTGPPT